MQPPLPIHLYLIASRVIWTPEIALHRGRCESYARISGRSDPWYDHRHLYLVLNHTLQLKWIVPGKWRDLRQCLMPCDDRWDALTIELARLTCRTNVQLTISFDWKISNTIGNQTAVFAFGFIKFILIICIAKPNPNPYCWPNTKNNSNRNLYLSLKGWFLFRCECPGGH